MDFVLLAQVVDELAAVLPGARVDKVVQGAEDGLFLVLHQRKKNHFLLLSPDRSLPRIHLVSSRPAGTGAPAGFFLSLRKHLTNARLQSIGVMNRDRVVEMAFSRGGEGCLLIFELTGAVTNLLLTDGARTILTVLHPVPPGDRVRRPLLPGLAYSPPERGPRSERARSAPGQDVPVQGCNGITPVNSAAEAWYERTKAEKEISSRRRQLASVIRKALARAERRREAVALDVAAAERGDELRLAGELLLANKHRIIKGQEHAELSGFDGQPVSIVLDPSRSPLENAERYFQRYKKAKAGLAIMRARYAEARDETAFLMAAQEHLTVAASRDELLAVLSLLMQSGYIRDSGGKTVSKKPSMPPYREIRIEGWQIVVGKSSAGNDYITTKLARPDDLWLHAEGMPGSHVVVRNPEKRDVPENVLRKAASLAAYYSKGRNSSKVPVAYTPAKFVKKPRGAAPGTVVLTERRTMLAPPEAE